MQAHNIREYMFIKPCREMEGFHFDMKRISATDWIEPHINQHTGPTRPLGSLYSDELLQLGSGPHTLRGPGVGGTASRLRGTTGDYRAGARRDEGEA